MFAGDEKQDESERLSETRENSAAPKRPGDFTKFMYFSEAQPPAASGLLNTDAPTTEMGAEERAHSLLRDGIPPAPPGTFPGPAAQWNEPLLEPVDPLRSESDSFPIGNEPAPLLEPLQGRQRATHLFSGSQSMAIDPVVPADGPSEFTQVINSSALRAKEEKSTTTPSAANNTPPPEAASASAPVASPQWPVGSVPSPQMYSLPYMPQPQVSMPAVAPPVWPQASMTPSVSLPSVPQPQMRLPNQEPRPGWTAYMPLIIGLNVLLFLTAIFILIFAFMK